MSTTIEVFNDASGVSVPVGRAYFTRSHLGVSTTFTYEPSYLAAGGPNIDPRLALVAGPQHSTGLLPAFADCAPDRWGRNLLLKAERARALEDGRRARDLDDVDFLLGVTDEARQGSLRFRELGEAAFASQHGNVPTLIALPALLEAARQVATDPDPWAAAKALLDTGTAGLGGARPKASVRLKDGALGLAKFSHPGDEWDVMAWEATALDLLSAVGIPVPDHHLVRIGGSSVLVLRRFDRAPATQHRIGYISSMTASGLRDGQSADYTDIADALRDLSDDLPRDHRDLFSRVVASVALRNTDDHLRNHGLLSIRNQWRLSPAFDVNPNPDSAKARSTSIAGAVSADDEIEGLLALAPRCGLTGTEARQRMSETALAMRGWAEQAAGNGMPPGEISRMRDAITPGLDALASAGSG